MFAKKKKKKLWIPVIALILVAALGAGIWFGTRNSEPVNVYPFMNIGMTEFWGDNQESYGPVTTDKIQTIFLTDTQTVTEVAVKDGDTVKKGDLLFTFDTSLDGLSLERKRLEVEKVKLQIKLAGERLEETYDMVPYNPPGIKEEEPDLGEELKDKLYKISENEVYDGSKMETALICWLKDGTVINDAILRDLYETALKYQTANANKPKPEEEEKTESSASDVPDAQQPATDPTQPEPEKKFTVPGFFTCNGETVTPDDMAVGKEGYTIRSSYTYQEKTYWLESAVRKSDKTVLKDLKIEAYPQNEEEQADWEAKWGSGVEVKYMRDVSVAANSLLEGTFTALEKDQTVTLEIGQEAVLTFRPQMKNAPEGTKLEFTVTPSDGLLKATVDQDLLILTGNPEKLTETPVTYTVTARYSFDDNYDTNRAVEETFPFRLSVVPGEDVKKGEFYVVFKVTEENFLKGVPVVWQGAKVTVYEDGRFGMTPFDASALEDHTLPPPEELEIELPAIDPNGIYTAEEILQMQKDLNITIKEQKAKLKMVEAEYQIMERELGDGNVYAEIDGKVVSLLTEEEAREQKQPLIKVSGGGGFYIEGSVSELEKDKLKPGQEVTVNDWNSGGTYTGEVVSIGDFPSDEDNWNGVGNPTASYYPFVAFVDESADLQAGNYVSMTYSTASAEQGIYLEKAFVRSEKGEHWIYVRGADGRLEKRNVQVGKVLWGSYYEILSPLGEEDFLAFPYGKQVKDGAPTVESDLSTLYTY